ncbi:MAG: hypothetical protein WA948_08875 [Pontixanthobacter sp.]
MFNFTKFGNRAIAAVTSVAFSVVIFATAILPANQGLLLPAGIA